MLNIFPKAPYTPIFSCIDKCLLIPEYFRIEEVLHRVGVDQLEEGIAFALDLIPNHIVKFSLDSTSVNAWLVGKLDGKISVKTLLSDRKEFLQEFVAVDRDVFVVVLAAEADVLVQHLLTLLQR